MATYLMFGTYSPEALRAISDKRTEEAMAIIRSYGGEFIAAYASLGEVDLVAVVELPDTERAMLVSVALTKLLGISFRTSPAISVDDFDKLMS